MIKKIIELFYNLSKEHIWVKSFRYDTIGRGAGVGSEAHPQVFLEEHIYQNNTSTDDNRVSYTFSFDVLDLIQTEENFKEDKQLKTPEQIQSICSMIADDFVAKINNSNALWLDDETNPYQPFIVENYSMYTLRYWQSNSASGVRVTITLSCLNPIDNCEFDLRFDTDKELEYDEYLPNLPNEDLGGCGEYVFKLPKIDYD